MDADRIIVLDDGRVAGIGTHAELMKIERRLSRDRRLAGLARGGRMSDERAAIKQQAAHRRRRLFGTRADGRLRHARAESQRLQGHAAPPERLPAAARAGLIVVIAAGVLSTLFSVVGPKLLGKATTKMFEGYLARNAGRGGIDFAYVGRC